MSLAPAAALGQQRSATRPFTLVILGDSLTAGFGLQRSQSFPSRLQALLTGDGYSVRVINAGLSGDTTAGARDRFDFAVPQGTNGLLIAIGGNDMLRGLPVAQARANINALILAGKARGATVALSGMRAPTNWGARYRQTFDAMYPDLARVHGVALDPFLLDGVALDRTLNQADGIHPNAAGAERIARRLAPFIIRTYSLRRVTRPAN